MRAALSSLDMSAPFRQGIFFISRPKQFWPAFGSMFKPFFSDKAFQAAQYDIFKRPSYALMKTYKLSLTDIGSSLSTQEETFMSRLANKVPFINASNRSYVAFLNKLRADVFDDILGQAEAQGYKPVQNPKFMSDLAGFINNATGRGNIEGIERYAAALNAFFFSPRLMYSRIQTLNPFYYGGLDPFVRKEAIKSLAGTVTILSSILTLAKMGGASVELDPRSADFAKIKVGNTRYDVAGGYTQYIRLLAQLMTNRTKTSSGRVVKLGEQYGKDTRKDIAQRFLENKTTPAVSFLLNFLKGKTFDGKKFELPKEILKRVVPMFLQDMYELVKEHGEDGILYGIPGFFGVGTQTYKRKY
jgi:hypothetical protein